MNANCQYDAVINVSQHATEPLRTCRTGQYKPFQRFANIDFSTLFFLSDISIAHTIVNDELRGPSSIENSAKNNFHGFAVRNFYSGCNRTKHPFGYIQSRKVRTYVYHTHTHILNLVHKTDCVHTRTVLIYNIFVSQFRRMYIQNWQCKYVDTGFTAHDMQKFINIYIFLSLHANGFGTR